MGHEKHDTLISPRRTLATTTDARIEVQGQEAGTRGDGEEGERKEKEGERGDGQDGERKAGEGQENHSDSLTAPLPGAVLAVGETLCVGKRQESHGDLLAVPLPGAVFTVGGELCGGR